MFELIFIKDLLELTKIPNWMWISADKVVADEKASSKEVVYYSWLL